jgi:hypothetical protein
MRPIMDWPIRVHVEESIRNIYHHGDFTPDGPLVCPLSPVSPARTTTCSQNRVFPGNLDCWPS